MFCLLAKRFSLIVVLGASQPPLRPLNSRTGCFAASAQHRAPAGPIGAPCCQSAMAAAHQSLSHPYGSRPGGRVQRCSSPQPPQGAKRVIPASLSTRYKIPLFILIISLRTPSAAMDSSSLVVGKDHVRSDDMAVPSLLFRPGSGAWFRSTAPMPALPP